MFGLLKIHKIGAPLLPIVSSIDSVTCKLSKELTQILSPITGCNGFTVKNLEGFANQMKNVYVNDNEIMISYDVTALLQEFQAKKR